MDLDISKGELSANVRSDVLLEKVEEIFERLQRDAHQRNDGSYLMHLTQAPKENGRDAGSADVHPLIRRWVLRRYTS